MLICYSLLLGLSQTISVTLLIVQHIICLCNLTQILGFILRTRTSGYSRAISTSIHGRDGAWYCHYLHTAVCAYENTLSQPEPAKSERIAPEAENQLCYIVQSVLISIVYISAAGVAFILSKIRTPTTTVIWNTLLIINSGINLYLYLAFSSELRTRCVKMVKNKIHPEQCSAV